MADYTRWWANRVGQYAAASTTPVRPNADAGSAISLATAPLTPSQHTSLVNDIVTVRDEEVAREEQKTLWRRIVDGVGGFLSSGFENIGKEGPTHLDDGTRIVGTGVEPGIAGDVAGRVGETLQPVGEGALNALETFDEYVFTPAMRGIATARHGINISLERQEHFWDFPILEGETWKDAWERSANTPLGVAMMEGWGVDEDSREQFHQDGFDEYGNPVNQAYRELREDNTAFNIGSGTIDFLKVWYAAPEVLAAKGITTARALRKGDLLHMSPRHQAKVRAIAATPVEHLDDLRAATPAWDYVGQRALKLREQTLALRDRARAGDVTASQLMETQAFDFSAQGPTAAHMFVEAAKTRRIDPRTGSILDEFDDDLFDMVTAAMLGHAGAARRLELRADEVGDAVKALDAQRLAVLDEVTAWGERVLEIEGKSMPEAMRRWALIGPQYRLDQARAEHGLVEQGLRQYQGYEDFIHRVFDEGPKLTMSPREARSIGQVLEGATAHTFKPTGHANVASQVISYPRAAWLKRPGIASLHSSEDSYMAGDRFLDQVAYYTKGRGLNELAQGYKVDTWGELRTKLLDNLAAASTDTERLHALNRIEDVTVAALARKYEIPPKQARELTEHVRGMRMSLIRQAEESNKSYSQATLDGRRIDTYRHKNADGTEEIIQLPVDVTQLRNTFIGVDLRAMDIVLKNHGNAIRAALWGAPAERTTKALEIFNHYWKPLVLFRMGYPVRNVIDDGARGFAASMSLGYIFGSAKAVGRGVLNVPDRVYNNYARTRNWQTRHAQPQTGRMPQALRESVGPIDRPHPERMTVIGKRDAAITKWERKSLNYHARLAKSFTDRGGRAPGGKAPTPPPIITKLNDALDNLGDAAVVDGATGRLRAANLDEVTTAKWQTAFDSTVRTFSPDDLDSIELHRFINEFADWVSNKGNGVLLRRTEDGGIELSVARRNVLDDAPKVRPTRELRKGGERSIHIDDVEFEGAFGPHGDMYRAANSSDEFNRNLSRSQELNTGELRKDGMQRTILAGEEGFEAAWVGVVNDHLRKSPIIRRMLDDWSDERIVNWLQNTSEGRQIARRMKHKSHNPVAWTDELRAHLNHYLPDARYRAIVRERDMTLDDIAGLDWRDPRPTGVDAPALIHATGAGTWGQALNKGIDKIFNAIATMPTDTLVRNPFFEQNYRYSLTRWLDTVDDKTMITPKMRQLAEKQARQEALKQTKLYMFSLTDQSELTHMLRFVSPFMGAWQESIIRWARITMERPEAFARIFMNGWDGGMDKLYGIEEDTDPLTGEPVVRVPMPTSIKKLAGLLPGISEGDLEGFENMLISKKSMNVTLQGTPWWLPSGGPLVQAPAAFFLQNSPELADQNALTEFAWKWMFPAGHPGKGSPLEIARKSILPSWMKQFERYHAEGDDPVYNNLFLLIYRTDYQRMKDAGQSIDTDKLMRESWDKAKGVQAFYAMSRLGSPFAFRLEPQSQFWIDKAREYREIYGDKDGLTHFVEDMGEDAYLWWTSLSKSNVNVPPTSEGWKRYKEFKGEIEKFPELAPLIIGMDAWDAEFNAEVYRAEQGTSVGPGDPRRIRSQKTGPEFIAEVEARQGWQEYRDWRAAIEAELAARGLTSINHRDAQDLLWANRQFINDQKGKLKGWGREFETYDSGRGYAYVDAMRNWVESGAANVDRPDIMGIAEYLEIHDAFAAELDARQLEGGSRSIAAQDNADLAFAWDTAMGDLVQRNPMFADVYYRYLERHTLRNGSN